MCQNYMFDEILDFICTYILESLKMYVPICVIREMDPQNLGKLTWPAVRINSSEDLRQRTLVHIGQTFGGNQRASTVHNHLEWSSSESRLRCRLERLKYVSSEICRGFIHPKG